jgi:hypothetical protein
LDVTTDLDAPVGPARLFACVEDLATYPRWLDLVHRVEPAEAHPDDPGPAWLVQLRARLGPLTRSKRLRMVRTRHDAPGVVTFERMEHDGRAHGAWVLEATTTPAPEGSRLRVHLHYDGGGWAPVLQPLLADEIRRGGPRLVALVQEGQPG